MKRFRSRMLATGLAVTVILGATPTLKVHAIKDGELVKEVENQGVELISTNGLKDVPEGYFAKEQIEDFVNKGILEGYEDGTFRPNNSITRAEFVKIVNKAFKLKEKEPDENLNIKLFSDVKADSWYAYDVLIAVQNGYIQGFTDNTFRPNEEITREQMAKILGVLLQVKGDGKTNFKDEKEIASWAVEYVDGLVEKGIISGYPDGEFKGKGKATRGESVALVSAGMRVKGSEGVQGGIEQDGNSNNQQGGNQGGGNEQGGGQEDNNGQEENQGGGQEDNNGQEENQGGGQEDNNGQEENQGGDQEEDNQQGGGQEDNNGQEGNQVGNQDDNTQQGGNQEEGNNENTDTSVTVGDISSLKEELSNPEVLEVEYKGEELTSQIEVPAGKTLKVANEVEVTGELEVKGDLILEGGIVLDKGGRLVVGGSMKNVPAQIKGKGVISIREGELEVGSRESLGVEVELTDKSKFKLGQELIMSQEEGLLKIEEGKIRVKANNIGGVKGELIVEGRVEVLGGIEGFVIKAKDESSVLKVASTEKVELEGVNEVETGEYRGQEGGLWLKVETEGNIEDNIRNIVTITTRGSVGDLVQGEVDLKVKVLPRLELFGQGSDQYKIEVKNKEGGLIEGEIDLDKEEGFVIGVQTPTNSKVTGLKINNKEVVLDKVIEPYSYVYVEIDKEDYNKLGLDEKGEELKIELIEVEGNLEGYTKGGIYVEDIKYEIYDPNLWGMDTGDKVTSSKVEVSQNQNTNLDKTIVEVVYKGESVRHIDLDSITGQDEVELKIHMAGDSRLNHIVFMNNYMELADEETYGKTVTVTLTGEEIKELSKDIMGRETNIQMTLYVE